MFLKGRLPIGFLKWIGVYLSDLLGSTIRGPSGERKGALRDLIATRGGEGTAVCAALIMRQAGRRVVLPMRAVADLYPGRLTLAAGRAATPFARQPDRFLLAEDVLDSQVIDLGVPRVVRVNDIQIEPEQSVWRVIAVDTGMRALLRRLLPRRLRFPPSQSHLIAWRDVEMLASEVPAHLLTPDHERLGGRHPADIARVTDALSPRQAAEIVGALPKDLAADTIEEMVDERQSAVIETLDPEQAAEILEHMAPNAAADVLADLDTALVERVLARLPPPEAASLHALLTYAKDTAGGLMTTDFVGVPRDLLVRKAAPFLRGIIEKPDLVYYIYVVEDPGDRVLAGVVSMRDLFLADPDQHMEQIMTRVVRHVGPETPAKEVARVMAEYNLMALPVLNPKGQMLGIVGMDDAMDVILPDTLRRRIPRVFS